MENYNCQEVITYPDLNHLPDQSPRERLNLLLEFVKGCEQFSEYGQKQAVGFFMEWIGQLYLEYFQNNRDEAEKCGVPYRDLLISLLESIEKDYVWNEYSDIDYSGYADEDVLWEQICWICTNVAAFNDMFGNFVDLLEGIEDDVADSPSWQHGGDEKIQKIVPRTHWWWFAYGGKVLLKETIDFD